jgi:hypothetical protein
MIALDPAAAKSRGATVSFDSAPFIPQPEVSPELPRLKHLFDCVPCMQKLDRLDWKAGIAFTSHGARIRIRTNEPAVLDRVREHLPPG